MKKTKTTAQKLKNVKSYETQEKLLMEWKSNWYKDQYKTIYMLRQAAMKDDHNTIMYMIDMLEGMTEKRFKTLEHMIQIINNRDYELIRMGELCASDQHNDGDTIKYTEINEVEDLNANKKEEIKITNSIKKEFNIDEMSKFYKGGMSVADLAEDYGFSEEKIIKLLVTNGVYSSDIYDRIKDMRIQGKTDDEIMSIIGISKKSFNRYIPYKKGVYGLKEPSNTAKYLREWRKNKR